MIAPPVQVPCVVVTETKDVPAGSGSATLTPVAPLGPLFVTVIVQVIWLPSVEGLGAPDFAIARSMTGGGGGGDGGTTCAFTLNGSQALNGESVWLASSPATYVAWKL